MLNGRYKIGICQWSVTLDGADICRFAGSLGLDGVQLEIGTVESGYPLTRPAVQREYLERASEHGIQFTSIATRVTEKFRMTDPAGTEDSRIVWDAIERSVEVADAMGIKTIMIGSFRASAIHDEAGLVRTAEVLTDACDLAAKKGIVIAAENVLSADEMYRLAEMINRPNLRLYFDTQNYVLRKGYDPSGLLKRLAPLLCGEMHIKDGVNDISEALLGEGSTDFFRTMKTLREIDYSGWLVLENFYDRGPLGSRHPDPAQIVREDLRILEKALSQ